MKKILTISVLSLIAIIAFIFFEKDKNNEPERLVELPSEEKIKIAACPTCFEIVKNINLDKYEIIKTASTAESLAKLKNQTVDMILAGRTLKPNEPQMDKIIVKEGFSFLSNKEMAVNIDQLKNQTIYTDLDIEIVKNILPFQKIETVDDVYDYLDQGIAITSWENTDYTQAKIIHVLEKSGERFALSRRPTVYCPNTCGEKAQEIALLLK